MERTREDFFVYQASVASIAAGASAIDTINIQADSDFVLQKLVYFADIAAAAQTASSQVLPLVTMQLNDTGTGNNLFSDPMPIPALFGTGQLPFILPNPRRFAANSTIQLSFVNYDVASTYQIYVGLVGRKIYQYG